VCEDPSGIAIVYDDQYISGFVVGTIQPVGFYRRLIQKRWWKFGLASVRPLMSDPRILLRLLRALTLPGQTSGAETRTGLLMSLAVMHCCQRQGIGKQLVFAFLETSRRRQVEIVSLTTDALDNQSTNEFYLQMGFKRARAFSTPEGRLMNEYVVRLCLNTPDH
jgi:ribosomal protein S18 acetylase RimI-like enzyme